MDTNLSQQYTASICRGDAFRTSNRLDAKAVCKKGSRVGPWKGVEIEPYLSRQKTAFLRTTAFSSQEEHSLGRKEVYFSPVHSLPHLQE
jgi:hypothetical protein